MRGFAKRGRPPGSYREPPTSSPAPTTPWQGAQLLRGIELSVSALQVGTVHGKWDDVQLVADTRSQAAGCGPDRTDSPGRAGAMRSPSCNQVGPRAGPVGWKASGVTAVDAFRSRQRGGYRSYLGGADDVRPHRTNSAAPAVGAPLYWKSETSLARRGASPVPGQAKRRPEQGVETSAALSSSRGASDSGLSGAGWLHRPHHKTRTYFNPSAKALRN